MEPEENLFLEKQNSKKNVSLENSSSVEIPPKSPELQTSQSPIINIPENDKKISSPQTQPLINLALKDIQLFLDLYIFPTIL